VAFNKFTTYRQLDAMDCGPTCLKMVFKHYGKQLNLEGIKQAAQIGSTGVSLLGIAEAAEKYGFRTVSARVTFEQLLEDAPLPCILHWNQYHFVVLTPEANTKKLTIADPAKGLITLPKADFIKNWISVHKDGEAKGIVLLLTPRVNFYEQEDEQNKAISWSLLAGMWPSIGNRFFSCL
jgi:ATP-binding cassette, subfamily B, bacterial